MPIVALSFFAAFLVEHGPLRDTIGDAVCEIDADAQAADHPPDAIAAASAVGGRRLGRRCCRSPRRVSGRQNQMPVRSIDRKIG